jgi:hypothetical protein
MRQHHAPRRPKCCDCPFRAPSGECRDPVIKSGRCGDWVWYMRGRKQLRHLYVKPKDPCSRQQLYWRARFGAASKKYSHSLTDDQQDACITAGAKLRSRPRLGQSGALTGQQYSIRREYAAKAAERPPNEDKMQQGLQTQGISQSTSGPHRGIARVPPEQHQRDTGRATNKESRRKNKEGRRQGVRATSQLRQLHRFTRNFPVSGRASVLVSPRISRPRLRQGSRSRSPSLRRRRRAGSAARVKAHRRREYEIIHHF